MCERHATKVYLNKEQAQRDGTKVKIREMKALHLFRLFFCCVWISHTWERQEKTSGIYGISKSKISSTNLQFR